MLFGAGLFTLFLCFALGVITIARQVPWQDEVFVGSTAWSMLQSHGPRLSVLSQYPHSGSPLPFYGPVSFEVAAALMRWFGLSPLPWRLICLAGVALTAFSGTALVRTAGGDRWAQLATALTLTLSGTITNFLPGRWDSVTIGLFLLGMLPLAQVSQGQGRSRTWSLILSGGCMGIALGSTPRTLTLVSALVISALLTALLFRDLLRPILITAGISVAAAFVLHSALLWPWGLTPFSWLAFVRQATRGDTVNATAFMGGRPWQLDVPHHKIALILLLTLIMIAACGIRSALNAKPNAKQREVFLACRVFLGIFAIANIAQMLLLVANPLTQGPFWMPQTVIAAMCWLRWESMSFKRLGLIAASLTAAILVALMLKEVQLVAVTLLTWNRRDTAGLAAFVRRSVPAASVIYGPVGGYFYPVEMAGRQYLYTNEETTPGLVSEPRANIGDKLDSETCAKATYLIWPKAQAPEMPQPVRDRLLAQSAEFDAPRISPFRQSILKRISPEGNDYGYPDTAIYRLRGIPDCAHR